MYAAIGRPGHPRDHGGAPVVPTGCRRDQVRVEALAPGNRGAFSQPSMQPSTTPFDDEAIDADMLDDDPQLQQLRDQLKDLERAAFEERQKRVQALGEKLQGMIDQRRSHRVQIEQRWLQDMRQYNNQYEREIEQALKDRPYGSRAFVPATRRVVDIIEARMMDLLFTTEERSFVVKNSPVPELVSALRHADRIRGSNVVPIRGGQPIPVSAIQQAIRELREEAAAAASKMQRQIDDRLQQCNYPAHARIVLHEGLVLGSGVIKAPFLMSRTRRAFSIVNGQAVVEKKKSITPGVISVSVWDYFPDLTVNDVAASESDFERHRMNKAEVAKLAEVPGFDPDAVREVLKVDPSHNAESYLDELKEAPGTQGIEDRRYWIWEYNGPVDTEDLRAMGEDLPDDALVCYEGTVWFADGGIVLKAIISPLDTEKRPYSVWNWHKDSASIFGYGVPFEMRDLQLACNSSFRAIMDAGGLSVKPVLLANPHLIAPVHGSWTVTPDAVFLAKKEQVNLEQALVFKQIDVQVDKLLAIFNMVQSLIELIGGAQLGMHGTDAPSLLKTDLGRSMAFSAAHVWMRRSVRNWDDQISVPTISRMIDWEMQYNPDPEIKGDFEAIARGVAALAEAEGQVQKMELLNKAAEGLPMPIRRRVARVRAMADSLRMDPSEWLPDDDEMLQLEEAERKQQAAGPQLTPEQERIKVREMEIEDRKLERQHAEQMQGREMQIRLAEIASREQITAEDAQRKYMIDLQKLQATLADRQAQREHDAQKFNAELVTKQALGTGI